jgi:YggT family protein
VDVAAVAALLLAQAAKILLLRLLAGGGASLAATLAFGLRDLAITVLQFYFWVLLVHVLLSWFAPGDRSAGPRIVRALCEPLLAPVRRILPPLGMFDLSPLVVMIGLQALQILLR